MVLADTSIWIDHLHKTDLQLANALESGSVCIHEAVIGEVACGTLKGRKDILEQMSRLPRLLVADFHECMTLIDEWRLSGRGLGWVDIQLLASCRIDNVELWTRDGRC